MHQKWCSTVVDMLTRYVTICYQTQCTSFGVLENIKKEPQLLAVLSKYLLSIS